MDNGEAGGGLMWTLFVIFVTLKLTGYVTWSWWLVTAPLWGSFVIFLIALSILMIVFGVIGVINKGTKKKR